VDADPTREALHYLVGRQLLDGATPGDLAKRLNVSSEVIEEGWAVSQKRLSQDLTAKRGEPFRLLSMDELQANIGHCLRRLLDWRERLRWVHISANAGVGESGNSGEELQRVDDPEIDAISDEPQTDLHPETEPTASKG
jgi:hypothetical protein